MLIIHIEIDIGDLVMDFELKQMKPAWNYDSSYSKV